MAIRYSDYLCYYALQHKTSSACGLSLPRNSATINWQVWHDLVVDWAVKRQHKQTKLSYERASGSLTS